MRDEMLSAFYLREASHRYIKLLYSKTAMEMDDQERLQRIEKLVEENNTKIRKLHSDAQWSKVFKIVYWLVIIGLAVSVFYFLQPYVAQLFDMYSSLEGGIEEVENAINSATSTLQ